MERPEGHSSPAEASTPRADAGEAHPPAQDESPVRRGGEPEPKHVPRAQPPAAVAGERLALQLEPAAGPDRAHVAEVVVGQHVAAVAPGGPAQRPRIAQRRKPVRAPGAVDQSEKALLRPRGRRRGGRDPRGTQGCEPRKDEYPDRTAHGLVPPVASESHRNSAFLAYPLAGIGQTRRQAEKRMDARGWIY